MITRALYIKRKIPVLLTAAILYCVLLDWIMLGERFWKPGLTGLMSVLCTLPMVLLIYVAFSKVADLLRQRFPGDQHFFRRAFVQIFLYLLVTALILLGLFSLYRLLGWIDSTYETRLMQSFLFAGIVNIFLSFFNEALFHFERWKSDLRETEQLKLTYKQGQLMGLKSQINPHVLFNSLNSLSGLIQENTSEAERFLDEMSKVYRYMLRNEEESLVTLQTEIQFIQSYFALLKARYNEGIELDTELDAADLQQMLPPLSLQVILENAIFQNRIAKESPLKLRISSARGRALVVSNNIQRKVMTEPIDYEAGLDNLVKKYQLLSQPPVEIREEEGERRVRLPLMPNAEEVTL